MSHIYFISQNKFKTLVNDNINYQHSNYIAISVVTEEKDKFELNTNFKDSVQLVFGDDENSFTKEQALQIINLVKNNQQTNIVVHCLMGISRSAAIALFLDEWLNQTYISDISRSRYVNYNRHVYTTLLKTFNEIE